VTLGASHTCYLFAGGPGFLFSVPLRREATRGASSIILLLPAGQAFLRLRSNTPFFPQHPILEDTNHVVTFFFPPRPRRGLLLPFAHEFGPLGILQSLQCACHSSFCSPAKSSATLSVLACLGSPKFFFDLVSCSSPFPSFLRLSSGSSSFTVVCALSWTQLSSCRGPFCFAFGRFAVLPPIRTLCPPSEL